MGIWNLTCPGLSSWSIPLTPDQLIAMASFSCSGHQPWIILNFSLSYTLTPGYQHTWSALPSKYLQSWPFSHSLHCSFSGPSHHHHYCNSLLADFLAFAFALCNLFSTDSNVTSLLENLQRLKSWVKAKVCTLSHKVLSELASWDFSDLMFQSPPPHYFRVFAYLFALPGKSLPPNIYMTSFWISFRSLFQCHLLVRLFLDILPKISHPLLIFPIHLSNVIFFFLGLITI